LPSRHRDPNDIGRAGTGAGPTVTVVTPTFNHAAYIGEAIESVLAQTFPDWQMVVVDDGSTDDTVRIARSFSDPRIIVLANRRRGHEGLAESYRDALSASAGRLVAVLEGDDSWPSDKLALQVPDFERGDVVLSYGAGFLKDDFGCEYGLVIPSFDPSVRTNEPVGSIVPAFLSVDPILSPTVVVRRAALESIGGFWQPPGVPYVDHPTWLLLALEGTFAFHSEPVGCWRRHAAQWTTRLSWSANESTPPEAVYLARVVEAAASHGVPVPRFDAEGVTNRHRQRWITNRWRLVLLAGSPRDVASYFLTLVRTRSLRLCAVGVTGLVSWLLGSDLEWIQRRRHRVSWPSRRHSSKHRSAGQLRIGSEPDL
jgi:glycosyltransferase involved in cell wall biosynthesis